MTSKPSAAAAAAAQTIATSATGASVTTPGGVLPEDAPPVKFDRLSVERRILGAVTDDHYSDQYGARNHLVSIADWALKDPNTINPPAPNARLDVAGLEYLGGEAVQKVEDCLDRLVAAGLVEKADDATYHVTKAGAVELAS